MKYERIKAVAKDGVQYSKPLGDIEIYLDNGEVLTFDTIVKDVLQLKEDLITKERDLKASQEELNRQLDSLKNVDLTEMRVVLVSLADRLKQLEDETDII